jgi:hypothetical protein
VAHPDGAAEVAGPAVERGPRTAPPPGSAVVVAILVIFAAGSGGAAARTQEAQVVVAGPQWTRSRDRGFAERQEAATQCRRQPPICQDANVQAPDRDGETCPRARQKDGTFEQVKGVQASIAPAWTAGAGSPRRWRPRAQATEQPSPAWRRAGRVCQGVAIRARRPRTETLTLGSGHGTCDVSDAVWRKYTDGQKFKVEVHSSGDVACSSL